MNILKKICVFVLASANLFTLAACGNKDLNEPAEHRDAVGAVTKKGVCVSRYNDGKASSAQKVNDLNTSWYYTWGVKSNNDYISSQFVPMIWGAKDVTADNIAYVKQNYESGKFTHLLTFNEPDLKDQSDMTVEQALSHWEDLQSIGIPLSSPVVSWYDAKNGNPWLDDFMKQAEKSNYRVDFITIHLYQSFYSANAVKELQATLDALYTKFKKPIWLTEFGAIDIIARDSNAGKVSASCTATNAKKYIEQASNMLEQCGYVERYSWFVDNFAGLYGDARPWEAPYTTLYNDDDTISEAGKTYRDIESVIPLILETSALESGKINTAYSQRVSVCGGTGNYTFTANGLPAGLSIAANGTISGKPTASGIYNVKVTVTDSGKSGRQQTRTHTFTLNITA